jgi:hypothetical protein
MWSQSERLFRLTNSLRGAAAEYAFSQLPSTVLTSYPELVEALEVRFKTTQPVSSYLAQIDNRKLGPKEKMSEYIADLRHLVLRGYPTADVGTRETIVVRHFMRGLPDQQVVLAVGMKEPKTVEEARAAVETYTSLKDDMSRGHRIRAVQEKSPDFVTEKRLEEFRVGIESRMDTGFSELKQLITKQRSQQRPPWKARTPSDPNYAAGKECYKCHEIGHFAKYCPSSRSTQKASSTSVDAATPESQGN